MATSTPSQMDGYIRVSRVGGREGPSYISPQVQKDAIQRWAEFRGVEIIAWHVDEDESGGTQERPGLRDAIARIEAGETQGIACFKLNRFARNVTGAMTDIRHIMDSSGVLCCVEDDIDPTTPNGRAFLQIMLVFAELERDNIAVSWRIAQERAIVRGASAGPTSYGYRRADDGSIETDPDTAPIVAEAFRLAADRGVHAALDYLREFKPYWRPYHVRRMLTNRAYLGEQRYGDLFNPRGHDPIVSRDLWERAQPPELPVAKRSDGVYPLSGIATCATCGDYMIGGGGRNMYTCRSADPRLGDKRCPAPAAMKAPVLEGHLIKLIQDAYAADGRSKRLVRRQDDAADLEALQDELLSAEAERDRFAADATAFEIMGEVAWTKGMKARAERVAKAQEAYRKAAKTTRQVGLDVPPDALSQLSREKLEPIFRDLFANVVVHKRAAGRGLSDRIGIVLHSDADTLAA